MEFYGRLGFQVPTVDEWVATKIPFFSIHFGDNKINVHTPGLWRDDAFDLRGPNARPGCGDFCFVWDGDLPSLQAMLADAGANIVEGPLDMIGGRNLGRDAGISIYTRDPDANLLEFIVYDQAGSS